MTEPGRSRRVVASCVMLFPYPSAIRPEAADLVNHPAESDGGIASDHLKNLVSMRLEFLGGQPVPVPDPLGLESGPVQGVEEGRRELVVPVTAAIGWWVPSSTNTTTRNLANADSIRREMVLVKHRKIPGLFFAENMVPSTPTNR